MKDRILNAVCLTLALGLIFAAFYIGCRALNNDQRLWLFAAAGVQSPRGAETFAAPSQAISVTLRWTHPGGVQGYRIYMRRSGVNYSNYIDAGTNLTLRITGLQRKTTYKCVATSYNGGFESVRSEELTFRTGNNANDPPEEL